MPKVVVDKDDNKEKNVDNEVEEEKVKYEGKFAFHTRFYF